ncbi:DUF3365 domain-containing protein [Mariprofundus sp. KV]|uniref:c-type heme family protein n=1 Tax=Mariprofundus sp. KV TaxID=2608715 RepID=UPI00159FD082|nr:DUF3365 domain-containing protein [Mariprofundus sp. KV]NWF37110.1 DUF3365 domain-containing protein [Mariprofundus sp. KV]
MSLFGNIRGWFLALALIWTLLLAFLLNANLQGHRESVITFAKSEADVLIQHIKAARAWNARHGGLYVEVNEKTPPNPYLEGLVEERDIISPAGRKLTLVNPAYMTRLINDQFNENNKRVAHITSLNPLRPENRADVWESNALRSFEKGVAEASEITTLHGKSYMRLMRPLTVQQDCLQCHASQGYKVGDIRGGITASVPFEKHARYLQQLNLNDSLTYSTIWLLGLIALGFGYKRLSKDELNLKQAEESVHILSASVEQASEAIIITDSSGIITYANPAFAELTGYSKDEVTGHSSNIIKSDQHGDHFYSEIWSTISSGHPWQSRIVNRRKDGSNYAAMLTISPIKNGKGEITHYVGSQQNLEEYEKLEKQFHQAQKMEALGTLVGGIAHDFNNTLAGITGNLYLAKKAIQDRPETVHRLETIEDLSYRTAGMIQQLLAFAREDVQRMNPMNISLLLKEALKMHMVSIPENIRLSINIESDDLHIRGDINLLQQALMNLINNARDAVEDVKDPLISIKLKAFEADDQFIDNHPDLTSRELACISIQDNGCGINSLDIEHIFDPFFTTKEVGKGTGLGLSMVYGAIQSHGGAIGVQSQVGQGTTISLWLPLLPSNQWLSDSSSSETVVNGSGETILLVDDELSVIETGQAVLESLGYRLLTAQNGAEAVAIFKEKRGKIDLILMDVVMPVMGGDEAANEIRKIKPDIKIIFATGYAKPHSSDGIFEMASETVISKPFSTGRISQLIRATLES